MPRSRSPILKLDQRAVFTPLVDLIMTSGGSLIVMTGLILVLLMNGIEPESDVVSILPKLLVFQILINWPHFLVSYRLLYSHKANFRNYPLATTVVPLVLVAICLGATLTLFGGNGVLSANIQIATTLWIFAALYLAWHYTGQAWGVMMVFAHLTGASFAKPERLVLKLGLKVLIAWHVVWGLETLQPIPYLGLLQSPLASIIVNVFAVIAFSAGVIVFCRKALIERALDVRIVGSWLAIYMWYLVLWLLPEAFMLVQLSHAVQYLVFPARVEMNKHIGAVTQSVATIQTLFVYAASIVGGLLIFYLPDRYFLSPNGEPTLTALLAIAINIHHYYTDGAIWKMRHKGVRQMLFAHLKSPSDK